MDWLTVARGEEPLIVSIPHAGTEIPPDIEARLVSPSGRGWTRTGGSTGSTGFAGAMGATVVRTAISRTVIDVNRDPSGESLYPGQATTGLCPDDDLRRRAALSRRARRRTRTRSPNGGRAGSIPITRRSRPSSSGCAPHGAVVLYDAHSIRSDIPRLFEGVLPNFNIGTNDGASCAPELTAAVEGACARSALHPGDQRPFQGRLDHPPLRPARDRACTRSRWSSPGAAIWTSRRTAGTAPGPFDSARAAEAQNVLENVLRACFAFARTTAANPK